MLKVTVSLHFGHSGILTTLFGLIFFCAIASNGKRHLPLRTRILPHSPHCLYFLNFFLLFLKSLCKDYNILNVYTLKRQKTQLSPIFTIAIMCDSLKINTIYIGNLSKSSSNSKSSSSAFSDKSSSLSVSL